MSVDHSKKIIEVKNISFSYGTNEILHSVSLDIHLGDYLGMIGPNGAGKTTLLKIMLGLLTPSRGTIKLFGTTLKEFNNWPDIGYVPQKATNFDARFPLTVEEVVMMGRYGRRGLFHSLTNQDKELVYTALAQVGMDQYRKRLIGDLSGGQQQRVFIARALATQPKVIFLDEPTTGIDIHAQDEFYALLQTLNKTMGLTLVLVSHDIERITSEAMHIACIDRTLTCHMSPKEYVKESASKKLFGETVKVINHHH